MKLIMFTSILTVEKKKKKTEQESIFHMLKQRNQNTHTTLSTKYSL